MSDNEPNEFFERVGTATVRPDGGTRCPDNVEGIKNLRCGGWRWREKPCDDYVQCFTCGQWVMPSGQYQR